MALGSAPPSITRIAVAGASGQIGTAILRALVADYEVIALTRSPTRAHQSDAELPIRWQHCDLFARSEVTAALTGVQVLVYLVHSHLPSARLDQAQREDMDLLIADNFGSGAAHSGVQQIIRLQGPTSHGSMPSALSQQRADIIRALTGHGVPVTVLHAGLIIAAGGTTTHLLTDLVSRARWIPVPAWVSPRKQPIAAADVARAVHYCITRSETYGQHYAIGGPAVLDVPQLLNTAAHAIGHQPSIIALRRLPLPRRLYTYWLRRHSPATHPAVVNAFVADLACDTTADDNDVQRFLHHDALPLQTAFGKQPCVDQPNPRDALRDADDAWLRKARTVRSIQRYRCPPGRNATWLAQTYFRWLAGFLWPFIVCAQGAAEGEFSIAVRWPRIHLLTLVYRPDHSDAGRCMYFISGGVLASRREGTHGRMEFHDVLGGRYTIVAIHDYEPWLPWNLYHATQAAAHGLVMRAFRRYLNKRH